MFGGTGASCRSVSRLLFLASRRAGRRGRSQTRYVIILMFHISRIVTVIFMETNVSVMRTVAPALMPVFRSPNQGAILAVLLGYPDREYSLTELARTLSDPHRAVAKQSVQKEVDRLVDAGILRERRLGRNRLVRANLDHPATAPLTQLALITFGPHSVIAEEFADLPGADEILIFGSWAARYRGETGHHPADIDVLVVGTTSRLAATDAARRAEERLNIPVNPQTCTPQQWRDPQTWTLLIEIQQRPYVSVYQR